MVEYTCSWNCRIMQYRSESIYDKLININQTYNMWYKAATLCKPQHKSCHFKSHKEQNSTRTALIKYENTCLIKQCALNKLDE